MCASNRLSHFLTDQELQIPVPRSALVSEAGPDADYALALVKIVVLDCVDCCIWFVDEAGLEDWLPDFVVENQSSKRSVRLIRILIEILNSDLADYGSRRRDHDLLVFGAGSPQVYFRLR